MVAEITLTPDNGIVGQTIQIDGTGFTATEDITLTYGGNPLTPVAPISTNGSGVFTGTFLVPASVQGIHVIVATDETLLTDDANFTVNSNITITEANTTVGGTINVIGTGYAGTSAMDFTFDGNIVTMVGGAFNTNATGGFTKTFIIPASAKGSRTLVGNDASLNTDNDTIIIIPLITLDDSSGSIGEEIVITGEGFADTEAITITFDGNEIIPDEDPLSSDGDGSFIATITVPTGSDGSVTIVATDETAGTDSATFIVILSSLTEVEINSSFSHLNGVDLNSRDVGNDSSIERSAIINVPFGSGDVYSTGGIQVDFSGVQGFSQVYLCKIIHNPIGLDCSFIPGAGNSSTLGKIKFWGTDGNELADNSSAITSKTLLVEIRGI